MSETNGRGADGRFGTGNSFGRGNPHATKVNRLRSALFASVSEADIKAAIKKLVEMAKGGDIAAIRELLDRTLGKASPSEILQRIEAIELALDEKQLAGLIEGKLP